MCPSSTWRKPGPWRCVHPHSITQGSRREQESSWRIAVGAGVSRVLGIGLLMSARPGDAPTNAQVSARLEAKDGGTVAVGDSAGGPRVLHRAAVRVVTHRLGRATQALPGTIEPDANGRCPHKGYIPIHGGCWLKVDLAPKDCVGIAYVYKEACYVPVFPPARPST